MNEPCFYRVSVKGIVIDDQSRILLARESDGTWDMLGGGLDHGEDPIVCLKREIQEESGLTELMMHTYLGSFSRLAPDPDDEEKQEYKTLHFFLFSTTQLELAPEDVDNPEARWVKKEEVEKYLWHPEDKRFYREVVLPFLQKH